MTYHSDIPSRNEAEALLLWANTKNPGQWVEHSRVTARAAETIAVKCSLDSNRAYILGLLHDIGRYAGIAGLRHVLSGHILMYEKGFPAIARISLTHSFPYKNVASYQGLFDCTQEEIGYIYKQLDDITYDDFDKLIQLCDCLSLPDGVCILEIRLVDVAKRGGVNQYMLDKWNAYFELKHYFDTKCTMNIYDLFYDEIKNSSFNRR